MELCGASSSINTNSLKCFHKLPCVEPLFVILLSEPKEGPCSTETPPLHLPAIERRTKRRQVSI